MSPVLLATQTANIGGKVPQILDGKTLKYRPMTKAEAAIKFTNLGQKLGGKAAPYATAGLGAAKTTGSLFWNTKNLNAFKKILGAKISVSSVATLIGAYVVQSAGGDFQGPMLKDIDKEIIKAHKLKDIGLVESLEALKIDVIDAQAYVDTTNPIFTLFNVKRSRASAEKTRIQGALSPLKNELNSRLANQTKNKQTAKDFIKEITTAKKIKVEEINLKYKSELIELEALKALEGSDEDFYVKQIAKAKINQQKEIEAKTIYYNEMLKKWAKLNTALAEFEIEQAEDISAEEDFFSSLF